MSIAAEFPVLRGQERDCIVEAITQDRIERVARIYHNNQDASRALGIAMRSFSRLCRRFEIETPYARKRRRMKEAASFMKEAAG